MEDALRLFAGARSDWTPELFFLAFADAVHVLPTKHEERRYLTARQQLGGKPTYVIFTQTPQATCWPHRFGGDGRRTRADSHKACCLAVGALCRGLSLKVFLGAGPKVTANGTRPPWG